MVFFYAGGARLSTLERILQQPFDIRRKQIAQLLRVLRVARAGRHMDQRQRRIGANHRAPARILAEDPALLAQRAALPQGR